VLDEVSLARVRRADGSWLYMLPSAIDDAEMGITHVIRGEDHVSNTALQIQMFDALGAAPPSFAHEALIVAAEGVMSKRLGSYGVAEMTEAGIEPGAVVALLARLGTADPIDPALDAAALAASFDLARFGRAPARFDQNELERVNAGVVHRLPFEAVASRLPAGMSEAAWQAIRPNLTRVAEAGDWWGVITGPVRAPEFDAETRGYLDRAAATLAAMEWGADPWHALTAALKESTGRKGKALFQPLRQALTGKDHGPDMAALLPLIGREEALRRLAATN
jgi:glutamyl-tRNA synthetase